MNERLRVAILTGCLFVIGLHLRQSGRLLSEVWRGPYAPGPVQLESTHSEETPLEPPLASLDAPDVLVGALAAQR